MAKIMVELLSGRGSGAARAAARGRAARCPRGVPTACNARTARPSAKTPQAAARLRRLGRRHAAAAGLAAALRDHARVASANGAADALAIAVNGAWAATARSGVCHGERETYLVHRHD